MQKDWNYIAKLESAIAKKYGKEAIQNPKNNWNKIKEKDYLLQLKKIYKEERDLNSRNEKVMHGGFLINKKLVNRDTNRKCPVCKKYSFDVGDDVYASKYECCYTCFVAYVHNREERWFSGWRPNQKFSSKRWYQKLLRFKYLLKKRFINFKR